MDTCTSGLLKTLSKMGMGDNTQMEDRSASSSKTGTFTLRKPGPNGSANRMRPPEPANLKGGTQGSGLIKCAEAKGTLEMVLTG